MNDLLAAVLAHRDEVDATDPPGWDDLGTPVAVKTFLRETVERNIQRRQLVQLYVVLGAEAVDPSHPAHAYFAQREETTYDNFELLLRWKRNPVPSARELMAFWTGLERQWIMNPSVDFLSVWDNFAERFFVAD